MHRLHATLLGIGVFRANLRWQPTPNRPEVGQDAGRVPLSRRLLSFPAMELRPLPLSLFKLFAERGWLLFFRHDFPSDYSLRGMLACPSFALWRARVEIRRVVASALLPVACPSSTGPQAARRAATQHAAAAKIAIHQNHSPKRANQLIREE